MTKLQSHIHFALCVVLAAMMLAPILFAPVMQ